jgi:capsule polysaccharide export protein KpsE/RkpR
MEKTDDLTFLELLLRMLNNVLVHIKLCLAIVAIPTIIVFVIVMWVVEPTYKASAIITPPTSENTIGNGISNFIKSDKGAGGMLGSLLNFSIENESDVVWTIFNSWELHLQVIEHFDLVKHYKFDGRFAADMLKLFRENFSFDYNDENMFEVSIEDKDYRLAAEMVDFMLDKADSAYNAYKTAQARQSRIYLEQRLDSCTKELNGLLKKFAKFQADNNFYDPEIQMESTIKYLSELQTKREDISLEMEYEKEDRGEGSKRYGQLHKRYEGVNKALSGTLSGKNRDVGIVSLKKSPELTAEYMQYKSEIKVLEAMYQMLMAQSEEMRLAESKMLTNLHVLEPPWENDKKVSPKRGVLLLFTMMVSSLLAFVLCSLLEKLKSEPRDSVLTQEIKKLKSAFRLR